MLASMLPMMSSRGPLRGHRLRKSVGNQFMLLGADKGADQVITVGSCGELPTEQHRSIGVGAGERTDFLHNGVKTAPLPLLRKVLRYLDDFSKHLSPRHIWTAPLVDSNKDKPD